MLIPTLQLLILMCMSHLSLHLLVGMLGVNLEVLQLLNFLRILAMASMVLDHHLCLNLPLVVVIHLKGIILIMVEIILVVQRKVDFLDLITIGHEEMRDTNLDLMVKGLIILGSHGQAILLQGLSLFLSVKPAFARDIQPLLLYIGVILIKVFMSAKFVVRKVI